MRKLGLAGAAAATIVAAAVAGGTFAQYLSRQDVPRVTAEAGTLTIGLAAGNNSLLQPWSLGPLAPVTYGTPPSPPKTVLVTNTGSVPGKLFFQAVELDDRDNGCNSPERAVDTTCGDETPNQGELSRNLQVDVGQRGTRDNRCLTTGPVTSLVSTNLTGLAGSEQGGATPITVPAGTAVCVVFQMDLPEETTNVVQSDSASFRMRFTLRSE